MESKTKKYLVGSFLGVLFLLGMYTVYFKEDKIEVTLPSVKCGTAMLRVTKDDFTLKCGRRIAFQADTIIEYFKTYGADEWVRNQRFVGRNKKDISLELIEKKNSFDIIRTTRYRKGRQSIEDGILTEIYTFTKDKVKITYDYEVKNKAEHKITMRIKKQYNSYLDAFDPNGYTGFQTSDSLSYKGFGNLFIDPTVSLISPSDDTVAYNETDTIPLICQTSLEATNVTLYWSASGTWASNGTETLGGTAATNTTFSRVIPHQTSSGTFDWNCYSCNSSSCNWAAANYTVNPIYKPNDVNLTAQAMLI